jgi:ribonuclease-3 family protein
MVQYNGQTLAYIGDAVFELHVRETLLEKGIVKAEKLHKAVIKYTCAQGQYTCLKSIESSLSEQEKAVVKRGRNQATARRPKGTPLQTYKLSTGFEALVGFLYLSKEKDRLQSLLNRLPISA